MDFEKAYEKFLNGTATPEEMEFVRSEMKKANDINNILTNVKNEGATNEAEKASVKLAMKRFFRKDVLKTLIIVCSAVLVIAIGVGLAIGIPILSTAGDNVNYTEEQAKTIALEHVSGRFPGSEVLRVERELEVNGRIKNAHYVYVIDVYNGTNNIFEIEVDSRTGKILEIDD